MTLVISKGLTLDNGTRAAAIAGVAPTLDYRFAREKREIETVSLTDKLTYTGGNGTFVGSDGFIQPATTNVPRFDHDPLSRQSLGLLSEVERTNLLLRSEEFDNAYWTKTRSSVLINTTLAPNGTTTAEKLVEDTTASASSPLISSALNLTGGVTYALSFFVKSAGRNFTVLRINQAGNSLWAGFDLSLGTVGTAVNSGTWTGAAGTIESVGNGWYRCTLTGAPDTTAVNAIAVIYPAVSASDPSNTSLVYTGNGSDGIFIWGAQLEAATTPSTYIPTTTTAVTRTADSAVIDGTGVLTGTYTLVEKPAGCAVVSGSNIELQPGFTAERVMVFPAALDAGQITAIRGAM